MTRRRILFGSAGIATAATASIATPTSATTTTMTEDSAEIINTVNKIALLSDRRDWAAVQACFTEQVAFDYTSLSGGESITIAAATQVQQWADFFSNTFKTTQHLIGSHIVTIDGDTVPSALRDRAICTAHFQAHHTYLDASKTAWLLAGTYDYELIRSGLDWKVQKMRMTALSETGDRPF